MFFFVFLEWQITKIAHEITKKTKKPLVFFVFFNDFQVKNEGSASSASQPTRWQAGQPARFASQPSNQVAGWPAS